MQIFSSCKDAIDDCIKTRSFSIAHLYNDNKPLDMHLHDCYEIYYSISGGKQFLIDNAFYDISPGDIFFINQYESHCIAQINEKTHERIVFSIHPSFLEKISSDATDLNHCFKFREMPNPHRLHLTPEEQKRFTYHTHKIVTSSGYGADLLSISFFCELMVFLNQTFAANCENQETAEPVSYHTLVDDILSYINQNIQTSLTIEELASHFYLSSSYLCRIFKATTQTTINKYITAKRISISKSLLAQGYSVMEACEQCGFNDYSNYLKAFTKAVGISPKKYAKFNSSVYTDPHSKN